MDHFANPPGGAMRKVWRPFEARRGEEEEEAKEEGGRSGAARRASDRGKNSEVPAHPEESIIGFDTHQWPVQCC